MKKMKTITSITRLIGKRPHKNVLDLATSVFDECMENNILVTRGNTPLNKRVIISVIRSVISNIKKGKGIWKGWSYKIGKDYIKLYDGKSVDMKELKFLELELYQDAPVLRVLVDPEIDGIKIPEHYVDFKHLKDAKKFMDETKSAIDIFVFIDKLKIPLNYKTFD